MSDRFTVRLDDDNAEWVEQEHEEQDRSRAWVINEVLRAVRGDDSTYAVQGGDVRTGAERTDVLDELKERIETLEESARHREERLSALESRDVSHESSLGTGVVGDDESPTSPPDAHSSDVSAFQDTPEAGGFSDGPTQADSEDDSLRAEALEAVEVADIPGRSEETRRARAEALLWGWDYLRAQGRAQSSMIANATFDAFDEDDIGYGAQERYRGRGLWQGFLRDELQKMPCVDGPGPKGRTWEFIEEEA